MFENHIETASDSDLELCSAGLVLIPEACAFLQISRSRMYELMTARRIRYFKCGRCRRIPRKELVRFAALGLVGTSEN